tara:strand:- start:199 stop:366 length:168 start_codon:yes stop_codon:yes gene_type:complete
MAEAKKKEIKKEVKKVAKVSGYEIKKPNGNVIKRDFLSSVEIKMYESKGCKVEAI